MINQITKSEVISEYWKEIVYFFRYHDYTFYFKNDLWLKVSLWWGAINRIIVDCSPIQLTDLLSYNLDMKIWRDNLYLDVYTYTSL